MNTDDWKALGKTLVGKGLPMLGTLVGGPAGAAIGTVGAILGQVLGVPANDPAALNKALQANPEAVVALRKIEADRDVQLQQLLLQQDLAYLQDVSNARSREVEVTKATGKKDVQLYVLAWTVVAGFLLTIVILAFADSPFTNNEAAMILLGALAAGFGSVLNYFFGSSRGSNDKTAIISAALGGRHASH